jgi:hypothetical protein
VNDLVQLDFFIEDNVIVLDNTNTKVCIECNKKKHLERFPADNQAYQGRKNTCKDCKAKSKALIRLYKRKHGSPDDNYECPVCGKKQDGIRRTGNSFNVDHCHITGEVRGYLCQQCNAGLGLLSDDTSFLKKAIEWIEKHKQGEIKDEES